ncbi:hypothetical protein [Lichenifustis flavocetrariae]|uniref:Uncharacterized protein n=1 Tax=Lichenifustis flavocetrariae TaxID=2949735 RepID=A0AA41Z584_9HYPH|nr:hypothetical protein [Lichenifustis flavocetrariae]MCW6513256.1 hypothetical protein [Lichenifustis flavocetrariae]
MLRPKTLVQYPWVVVRIECVLCDRRGRYRLARLAARYGPEQSLDGLLADLAHDCPWWRTNPRKYEPRCGARFADLERNLPPPDHPDEPVYQRRQPTREDVQKSASRSPPQQPAGTVPLLSTWPHFEIVVSCATCGRRDVLDVALLRQALQNGDARLMDLRVSLTAQCPRREAQSIYEQCGAVLIAPGQ